MFIQRFDTSLGIYSFEESHLSTRLHAHPAFEILLSKEGSFSLSTKNNTYPKLSLAIIGENVPHALHAENSSLKIIMIERFLFGYPVLLEKMNIAIENEGIYFPDKDFVRSIGSELEGLFDRKKGFLDERVQRALVYIHKHLPEGRLELEKLGEHVALSQKSDLPPFQVSNRHFPPKIRLLGSPETRHSNQPFQWNSPTGCRPLIGVL